MSDSPRLQDSRYHFPLPARTLLELHGPDARSFLHRFCTNDIEALDDGTGCEAFLTTVQGRTLGHVLITVEEESVILETVPQQADVILPHLDRYAFGDKVEMIDRSEQWTQWCLCGAPWSGTLDWEPELAVGANASRACGNASGRVTVAPFTSGGCWLLRTSVDQQADVTTWLADVGSTLLDGPTFDGLRIAAGFPMFGIDFSDQNLPQELDRNAAAISFTKGCYLGQETVARLDALGHVNKLLKRLEFEQPLEDIAGEVLQDEKVVGRLTSYAVGDQGGMGLAVLKRPAFEAGAQVTVDGHAAVVHDC
ncbi:MAG: hypothetical protein AAGF97_12740 [Planctomycetota bacterium]